VVITAIVLANTQGTESKTHEMAAMSVPEDLVVNEAEYRNRRQASPADFRPQEKYLVTAPAAQRERPTDRADPGGMADRRARRGHDPEDVASLRRSRAEVDEAAIAHLPDGPRRRALLVSSGGRSMATAPSSRATSGALVAPAGALVPAVLVTPIDLSSSSGTVIARVDGGEFPVGSRFIGTASATGEGIVSLRFSRLLLPDGRQVRVAGEAQDGAGAFGIQGSMESADPEEPSVAGQVAKDTAADLALDALGAGVAGSAARNYSRRSSKTEYRSVASRVSLAAGTRFTIFLHEAAIAQ
jgi:hypothetical protein